MILPCHRLAIEHPFVLDGFPPYIAPFWLGGYFIRMGLIAPPWRPSKWRILFI